MKTIHVNRVTKTVLAKAKAADSVQAKANELIKGLISKVKSGSTLVVPNRALGEKKLHWYYFKALRSTFLASVKKGEVKAIWKDGKKYRTGVHKDIAGIELSIRNPKTAKV